MGLDFTVYKMMADETCEQAWDIIREDHIKSNYKEDSPRELAYGRKSWELVYVLVPNFVEYENMDGWIDPPVTKERWDKLMQMIEPIGDKLDNIIDAFDREEYMPEDYSDFVFTDEHKKLIAEYEYWYNKTFDTGPTLGYSFSAYYMRTFWKANDEVQKVYEDPEWEVRASVSY